MNRRSFLASALALLAARGFPLPAWINNAEAREGAGDWRHGVSPFGELKYPSGFKNFDYVSTSAPKGGSAWQIALGSYDSFNMVVAGIKGTPAAGLELIYDTLMVPSLDEAASEYGLLAEAVSYPSDFSSAMFRLRPEAKWNNGKPVTPEDVIFSFNAFKKLSPQAMSDYHQVVKAEKTGEREVTFTFDAPGNRGLPQAVGH
ncbi:MAG: ABC transporter substrate-binding protein, partial [bacterium]